MDRMRPELKGGAGVCHHIAAQLAGGLPWGLGRGWGGRRRRLRIGFSRPDASQRLVRSVHRTLGVTLLLYAMRSTSFAPSCSVYSIRMRLVA